MSPQVHFTHKRHSTVITREWFESFVLPAVCDQIRRLAERLAAEATLVRFLARVNVRVFFHVRFLVESLAAEVALERARVRMDQHVRGQC